MVKTKTNKENIAQQVKKHTEKKKRSIFPNWQRELIHRFKKFYIKPPLDTSGKKYEKENKSRKKILKASRKNRHVSFKEVKEVKVS